MALAATTPYRDLIAGFAAPDRRLKDDEVADFIRGGLSTFFHPGGTCKMGTDDLAVTDPYLRVHGVDGLRIADASVIPIIPTCNTHAPVTMIGERAADFLMEDA
jgi:choline dehydrogenase